MNFDDIKQILELVREHDLAEFELERDGLKVRVRKSGPAEPARAAVLAPMTAVPVPVAPVPTAEPVPPAGALAETPGGAELAVVKSPIVGTFYRSSEPGAPALVEVGETVRKGQVLCIIEAMKLMNDIESDCDGEIAAVYVDNGKPVQFGERLFAIKVT
ncbi:MAG TPA: acetyl-CoA carboxylase biotin carboxyl carrier protein [Vicinamibacterales bacterium]|nr:acetyl-CoA carboxylase biotin carboxyl carrier protein [Vicinamibacterales bacterium]